MKAHKDKGNHGAEKTEKDGRRHVKYMVWKIEQLRMN